MQAIEKTIITGLIREMKKAGYLPAAVWDSEEYQMVGADKKMASFERGTEPDDLYRVMTEKEALASIASVDTSTLHFTPKDKGKGWGHGPGVFLVLGNGVDVISDYHVNADIDRITEELNRKHG